MRENLVTTSGNSGFDPETQIFVNRSSLGFVLETLPLVGCGDEIPRQLTGLFQHTLPMGSNLQCLLIASHRIGPWLTRWEEARLGRSEVLEELAKERSVHLGLSSGIRTFRLLLSYSEPIVIFRSFDSLISLREQIITTLKGWGLPVKVWQPEDLLTGLDELLNPSNSLDNFAIPWNKHDILSNQFMSPSTRWKIEPSQMVMGENEVILRMYTTRLFPPV